MKRQSDKKREAGLFRARPQENQMNNQNKLIVTHKPLIFKTSPEQFNQPPLVCSNCGQTGPTVRIVAEYIGGIGTVDLPHCSGQCERVN